mmetsp:Transcript_69122/g.205685  ORF Transcript_69122/g.205685 Transcript_69122/m.205685 type:complete len:301 (-) Transcript_69122:29-931(-)
MRLQAVRGLEAQQVQAWLVEAPHLGHLRTGHVHALTREFHECVKVVLRVQDASRLLADHPGLGLEWLVVLVQEIHRKGDASLQDGHVDAYPYLHARAELEHDALKGALPVHSHPHPTLQLLDPRRDAGHDELGSVHGEDAPPEPLEREGSARWREREELDVGAQVHQVVGPRLRGVQLCLRIAWRLVPREEEHARLELLGVGAEVEDRRARPEDVRERRAVVDTVALLELVCGSGCLNLELFDPLCARLVELLYDTDSLETVGVHLLPDTVEGHTDLVVGRGDHFRLEDIHRCVQGLLNH